MMLSYPGSARARVGVLWLAMCFVPVLAHAQLAQCGYEVGEDWCATKEGVFGPILYEPLSSWAARVGAINPRVADGFAAGWLCVSDHEMDSNGNYIRVIPSTMKSCDWHNGFYLWGATGECRRDLPCQPPTIVLIGPSSTKALPAGPVLPQTAQVTQGGAPVAGRHVTVKIHGPEGERTLVGTTNSAGQFRFTYSPPLLRAIREQITGNCSGCSNTAQKEITVQACDVCGASGE